MGQRVDGRRGEGVGAGPPLSPVLRGLRDFPSGPDGANQRAGADPSPPPPLNEARPALPESRTGLALRRDARGELRHGTMALRPFVPLNMNGAVMSDIQHCITKLAPLGVVPGTVECRFTSPNWSATSVNCSRIGTG